MALKKRGGGASPARQARRPPGPVQPSSACTAESYHIIGGLQRPRSHTSKERPTVPKQPAPVKPALFVLAELARYLNRSNTSIYRDLELGRIPAPVKIGGRQMWRRAEIDAWLEAGAPSRNEWETRRAVSVSVASARG